MIASEELTESKYSELSTELDAERQLVEALQAIEAFQAITQN